MIVTYANGFTHGYEIERVTREGGKTTIVLSHDHGLRIDGGTTQEVYSPATHDPEPEHLPHPNVCEPGAVRAGPR